MAKAKEKKTVPIDALIEYANGYLAADFPNGDSPQAIARRTGLIDMLEQALATAQRYRGYSYLDQRGFIHCKPGIRWVEGQAPKHTFHETDATRRRYA
jgi:hypothetical protein